MFIKDNFKDLPQEVFNLIGGPLHATVTMQNLNNSNKENTEMAMTKLDDYNKYTDQYNSLSFFMECLQDYINHNNLNPIGWKVVGFGTGTAYDSWHHQITIEAPSGMQKTIRVPMYKRANDNFLNHFIDEV